MVKIDVLASGSKGNATLVTIDEFRILVDVGISYRTLREKLKTLGVDKLDLVLITHSHNDHIKGLNQLSKQVDVDIYGPPLKDEYPNYHLFANTLNCGKITVEALELSHDCEHTYGYLIEGKIKIGYVSDSGYLSAANLEKLRNCEVLMLEANHDVEMLMNSTRYTWNLKQRIVGDRGHLSNMQFYQYVDKLKHDNLQAVIALHLSEENNTVQHVKKILQKLGLIEIGYVATQNNTLSFAIKGDVNER